MNHQTYFNNIIKDIESIAPGVTAVVISSDGLTLASHREDVAVETQLAALASMYLDCGKKVFSLSGEPSGNGAREEVHTIVTAGEKKFVVLTQLVGGAMLAVTGADKNQIGVVTKKSFEYMDKITTMIQKNELLF